MKKSHILILFIAAVFAATSGIWMAKQTSDDSSVSIKPEVIQGAIYPNAKNIKDFNLINHRSENITKENFKNHWSLIFVGYTHCPDICPTTMAVMTQVSEFMQKQQIKPPEIVFLSIDPERDTADILNSYVTYFNKDFIGLTGDVEEITQLSAQLNAVFRKAPGLSGQITDEDYLMDHSSALMLINPHGNLQSILTAPHTPANMIDSILKSQAYFQQISN
ncbi:MAG: SCO family protein [Gammaproteobacteria bacterium]|nr:SCO family protein [Gammaproteobacteria bacterium]